MLPVERKMISLLKFFRLALLIDSVLSYLVPSWNESKSSLNFLNDVKQLLLLSKKRMALIDTFLKDSESRYGWCGVKIH